MDNPGPAFPPCPAHRNYCMTSPETTPRLVSGSQIIRLSGLVGSGYRFNQPGLAADVPVLAGDFRVARLRPGLVAHCTQIENLHSMTSQVLLEPGLKFSLLLDGQADVAFGHRRFQFGPHRDGRGRLRHECTLLSLAEPDLFVRRARRGGSERKVSLTLSPQGLAQAGVDSDDIIRTFCREHLSVRSWVPSASLIALATQMLCPPPGSTLMQNLYLESRAIDLVAEALAVLGQPLPAAPGRLRPREYARLLDLADYLDQHLDDALSLDAIAREAGLNVTSLQRQFRAAFGCTVFGYLRQRKLLAARTALEKHGVSVGEAAHLAGYSSAANFATAYKRAFGMPPKLSRTRI